MKDLQLTDRAMFDLAEIRDYSINQLGIEVANRYIEDIQNGLSLIKEHPRALALTKIDPPSAHKVDPPTVGAHSN
jgi:plasmid stabilization system protein ParE